VKTKEELKQLAMDIVEGRVFGTWNLSKQEEIAMSFMALLFAGPEQAQSAIDREVVHIYEYLDKAEPRYVNGKPIFFSHHELTKQEIEVLNPLIDRLQKMREEFANA
jgi:hypothetical protein